MARRNLMRSFCAASLLALSGAVGVLVSPAAVGAADPCDPRSTRPDCVVVVKVHATHFEAPWEAGKVYARPEQWILFQLVDPLDRHHTVTIQKADCGNHHQRLCEQRFDDPDDDNGVQYIWSTEGEYDFYDRYAEADGRPPMNGVMIVTHSPPPIPPSTTTTTVPSNTTTTTAPSATTTSTAPTTTTTAPGTIRPFLIPNPAPTSTTTTAKPAGPAPSGGPSAQPAAKGKDKGKGKAAATETATTAAPAPSEGPPLDSVFDPATLTPGPTALPDTPASDEVAMDAAAVADLLDGDSDGDDGGRLVLYACGALAVIFVAGSVWGWHHRSSRYFPA